jgi:hypothetical protein
MYTLDPLGLLCVHSLQLCVCPVFSFKVTGVKPRTGLISVRPPKRAPTRTPPRPVLPHEESLAAQAAYAEALLPGYDNVFYL